MRFDRSFSVLFLFATVFLSAAVSSEAQADVYELRIYTTHEGKLDALNARFRDHTVALFKKHGIKSVGYWVPTDGPEAKNTLIYVIRHKSRDAAAKSWKAFVADPQWKKAAKASRADGPILAKRPESIYMNIAPYSPKISGGKFDQQENKDAVFELRIYKTPEGKLGNLDNRFKDHTIKLFEKHQMVNVAYWHPADKPDSANTLIYILKHKNREAAKTAWKAFIGDPVWQKAFKESRVDGPLLKEAPKSTFMKPTDYSALK